VLFASPIANNWLLSGHRGAIFGGACRRERAQAPTLKEVHKEQVGLATHASSTATQSIKARVILFSLFFLFFLSFLFFCYSLFFLFFFPPEANHNFLFVLADFALVENEKGIGGARRHHSRDSSHNNQRPWGK
jgi:hypothetical protein